MKDENFEKLCLLGMEIIKKNGPPRLVKSFFDTRKFEMEYCSRVFRYADNCLGIFNKADSNYRELSIWSAEESPEEERLACVTDCWQNFKESPLFRLKIQDYADGYTSSSCQVGLFGKDMGGASAYSSYRYPDITRVCNCASIMIGLVSGQGGKSVYY